MYCFFKYLQLHIISSMKLEDDGNIYYKVDEFPVIRKYSQFMRKQQENVNTVLSFS